MAGTRKKHQVSAKYGAGLVSEEKSKHTGRVPVPNPQQLIALVNRHELIKKGFAVPCLLKLLNQVGGGFAPAHQKTIWPYDGPNPCLTQLFQSKSDLRAKFHQAVQNGNLYLIAGPFDRIQSLKDPL